MTRNKFIYHCTDCGMEYTVDDTMYLCPFCSRQNSPKSPPKGVLKTLYDYNKIRTRISGFDDLKKNEFIDILPIEKTESLPNLRVGKTPLYRISALDGKNLPFHLYLKDDSQNPTFSFKDRASALVSAFAKEKKFRTIVAASTGNAGSSMAGICASQGQESIIMVPETAPVAKLIQIIMYGARVIPVKGTYDDAFDLSIKASEEFGWYNRNTGYNPLTIEGKKTVSFELIEQLEFKLPDRIFIPVGDGVIISGVYKGFEDLLMLNLIEKIPVIVAVQSDASDNLIRNIYGDTFKINKSHTVADSISVDIPRNFYMTRQFIQKYAGETISVSDNNIIESSVLLSKNTGIFAEPAAAAAFAGFLTYEKNGKLEKKSSNVVLLTGSGLKDPKAVSKFVTIPESVQPSIENLKKIFS